MKYKDPEIAFCVIAVGGCKSEWLYKIVIKHPFVCEPNKCASRNENGKTIGSTKEAWFGETVGFRGPLGLTVPTQIAFSNSLLFSLSDRAFSLCQFTWFVTITYTKLDLADLSSFWEMGDVCDK